MFRVYYNSSRRLATLHEKIPCTLFENGSILFETKNNTSTSYRIVYRTCLSNNSGMFEVVYPIEEPIPSYPPFQKSQLQLALVQQSSLHQLWRIEPHPLPQQPSPSLAPSPSLSIPPRGSQQASLILTFEALLSGSLVLPLPEWVTQELGPLYSQISSLLTAKYPFVQPDLLNQTFPELHRAQHQLQQEVYPSQSLKQLQVLHETHPVSPQAKTEQPLLEQHQVPSQQLLQSSPSCQVRKGVQTGSLCPPTLLPDAQPPRKSLHHLKERRQPPSQSLPTQSAEFQTFQQQQ